MGNRPATSPPVVIDTLDQATLTAAEETAEDSDPAIDGENPGETESGSVPIETSDVESTGRSSCSRSSTPVNLKDKRIKEKKRKRSKGEVVEDVMSKVMKTVTEGLKESDKMLMELEEKRMKFEEQQKREERQFQLQMMQILVGSSNSRPPRADEPRSHYYPMYSPFAYGESEDL